MYVYERLIQNQIAKCEADEIGIYTRNCTNKCEDKINIKQPIDVVPSGAI